MGKKRKQLSHEELWDDSGLIRAWDESYEEYKRYQSIAARGERIEDVLAEAESFEGEIPNGAHSAPEQSAADAGDGAESLEDGEVASSEGLAGAEIHEPNGAPAQSGPGANAKPLSLDQQGVPPLPQGVIDRSSSDDGLKDLMMSWYWAGYYTGYYEGQRSAAPGPADAGGKDSAT